MINLVLDHDQGYKPNKAIYFQEYRDFMLPMLPEGRWHLMRHVGSSKDRSFWGTPEGKAFPRWMTYEILLYHTWKDFDLNFNPVHNRAFTWAGDWDETDPPGWLQWRDREGLPILLFDPEHPQKEAYRQWEPIWRRRKQRAMAAS